MLCQQSWASPLRSAETINFRPCLCMTTVMWGYFLMSNKTGRRTKQAALSMGPSVPLRKYHLYWLAIVFKGFIQGSFHTLLGDANLNYKRSNLLGPPATILSGFQPVMPGLENSNELQAHQTRNFQFLLHFESEYCTFTWAQIKPLVPFLGIFQTDAFGALWDQSGFEPAFLRPMQRASSLKPETSACKPMDCPQHASNTFTKQKVFFWYKKSNDILKLTVSPTLRHAESNSWMLG